MDGILLSVIGGLIAVGVFVLLLHIVAPHIPSSNDVRRKAEARLERARAAMPDVCEKCLAKPGRPYGFYYGKSSSHRVRTDSGEWRTKFSYRVTGSDQVTLCDSCVYKGGLVDLSSAILVFAVIAALGGFLYAGSTSIPTDAPFFGVRPDIIGYALGVLSVICAILAVMFMVILAEYIASSEYRHILNQSAEYGEKVAISVRKGSLGRTGIDSFFTPKEREKLKPRV